MRFLYEYKSSDGVRHTGELKAASRDDVYVSLRRAGVKPFNVTPAPGFLNRLSGISRRWLAIVVLGMTVVALGVTMIGSDDDEQWTPSEIYTQLETDAKAIVKEAGSDPAEAREELRRIFLKRYPLFENARDREEAQALYGRLMIEVDIAEESVLRD